MKINGSCHCGHLTYRANINPDIIRVCHCTDCQSSSGSAFRVLVSVPAEQFELLSGHTKQYFKIADSGQRRAQVFCPECGTQLYGTSDDDNPAMLSLRLGTVEQRGELQPRLQTWRRSALSWVENLADVESVPRQAALHD
ncbi:MAG: GFA family protein [Hyphomicrobiaceae bacterium]